jgi:hypothetical protein
MQSLSPTLIQQRRFDPAAQPYFDRTIPPKTGIVESKFQAA